MTGTTTGWRPTPCRPGCVYAGEAYCGINGCNYLAITGQSRGCDPGKECERYRKRKSGEKRLRAIDEKAGMVTRIPEGRQRRVRKCNWDNERGYRLFQLGLTSGQIAGELGTTAKAVQQRRRKYWNHGRA